MMVDVTYQMVLSTIQTVGILIGIFYYIMTLQNTRKNQQLQLETRQAQLFMQLYSETYNEQASISRMEMLNEWNSSDKSYESWYQKYFLDPIGSAKFNALAIYLEGIGVLVKRKLIDPTYVDDLISSLVLSFWDGFKEVLNEHRKRTGDYDYCEWIEYLAEEIRPLRVKRDQKRKQHPELPT